MEVDLSDEEHSSVRGEEDIPPQLGIFSSKQAAIREISFRKGVRLVFTLYKVILLYLPLCFCLSFVLPFGHGCSCEDGQYIFAGYRRLWASFREVLSEMAKRCKCKLSHYIRVSIKTPYKLFPSW